MEHLAHPAARDGRLRLAPHSTTGLKAAPQRVGKQAEIEEQKLALETLRMELKPRNGWLEKCQNSEEVSQFLSTDAGKRFVERMQASDVAPAVHHVNSLAGIMALIVFGALGTGLGTAFYLLSKFTTHTNFITPPF